MKNPWIVIGGLVVVLIGGSVVYSQYAATQNNEGVEVIEHHVKGNPDADVTLVKYSDFSCPACGQAYPFVKEIVEAYEDDIRFEYRHFAFLELGVPAAMAAEAAAQQGKFFEYHDMLFDNQQQWSRGGAPQRYFAEYAEELDLDMDQWDRHRSAPLLRSKVQEDLAEGRSRGVTGTPTFFLNGERMEFESFDEFRAEVEEALGVEGEQPATEDIEGEPVEVELEEGGADADSDADSEASGGASVEFGI